MIVQIVSVLILVTRVAAQGAHPPRIVEHPIDTIVPRHEPATLNCKAEGLPTPSVLWYKDGAPLKTLPGSHRITLPAGGLFFLKVVNSRRETDAGVYWCEARNELGVARSKNATLQVAVLRDEFRIEPQNTRIAQSDTALLECAAPRGVPEPTVLWKKNSQIIDMESSKRIRIVDGGNLAIQDIRQSDEGQYQCLAKNPAGIRESAIATLKVHVKPFIIRGPHDQVVLEGSSVTFPCRVGGDPMPDVLWLRTASGGNMPLDRVSVLEDRSLRLERATVADEGEYSCEADNLVGAITAMGMLTVYAPPKFLQRPSSKSLELGSDTSFECRASGNPRPTIFWTIKNNMSIIFPGAPPMDRFHSINTEDGHSILTLTGFQRNDKELVIVCNAMNVVATITTRAQIMLDSQEERPPPIIITGPVNQTLPVKSLATLHCRAIGLPNPSISWFRDGIQVLPNDNKVNLTSSGDLVISNLDKINDQGLYTCVASSRAGKSTWSGYLRIEVPTNPNIKFYRAPEQSKCPSAPGQPKALNVSEHSMTIVWPSSDGIGEAPLLGYAVEMYSTNKSKTWIPIASRLAEPIFTVEGLTNGAAYMFIVRAESALGFSPPSPISEAITAGQSLPREQRSGRNGQEDDILFAEVETLLQSNDVVELLEANASDSTSVRLTWDIDNGQYIEGFYIYAREIHSTAYKLMTILNAGSGASACTVNGLQKASRYEFFLVPFYKSIVGKPSNAQYATTLEDVPEGAPTGIEAIQFNRSSVFLKWQPPYPNKTHNGLLISYRVLVKGVDKNNETRVYKNMTIDAISPTLLLANLTTGINYYIAVAAATEVGVGPFCKPVMLRMDPHSQSLDTGYTGYTKYPINYDISENFITQTWFIALLGSTIALVVFLFGALVIFKRYQFIKQTSLGRFHESHSIGNVRKFPTLQLSSNGVWIDPTGSVWRQSNASYTTKEQLPYYTQATEQQQVSLPDYERLTPLNMPDYAEVACSTFKIPDHEHDGKGTDSKQEDNRDVSEKEGSGNDQNRGHHNNDEKNEPHGKQNKDEQSHKASLYDSCGAYATTNLMATPKLYQNCYETSKDIALCTSSESLANSLPYNAAGNVSYSECLPTTTSITTIVITATTSAGTTITTTATKTPVATSLITSFGVQTTNNFSTMTPQHFGRSKSPTSRDQMYTAGLYSAPPSTCYARAKTLDDDWDLKDQRLNILLFGQNTDISALPDAMTTSTASTVALGAERSPKNLASLLNRKSEVANFNQSNHSNKNYNFGSTEGSLTNSSPIAGNKINIIENRFDLMGQNTQEPLIPTRLNPFNNHRQRHIQQQQHHQQQLLKASNVLRQGLGAYASGTFTGHSTGLNGGSTLKKPRSSKVFKSENNINSSNWYNGCNTMSSNDEQWAAHLAEVASTRYQKTITDHHPTKQHKNNELSSSTNHLLNEWSAASANDYYYYCYYTDDRKEAATTRHGKQSNWWAQQPPLILPSGHQINSGSSLSRDADTSYAYSNSNSNSNSNTCSKTTVNAQNSMNNISGPSITSAEKISPNKCYLRHDVNMTASGSTSPTYFNDFETVAKV